MNVYVYYKDSGKYVYHDSGHPKYTIKDIPSDCDFTLTPLPNTYELWRWIDDKWIADQPS